MNVENLQKNKFILLIIIIFIFTYKFFQSTPYAAVMFKFHAVFLGFILIFLIFYIIDILLTGKHINSIVFYFLLITFILPLYSAFRANIEFGQPYLYGILSERIWLQMGVGIWVYYVLVTEKISISTFQSTFVFMAWASIIIFSFIALTYDPSQYAEIPDYASAGVGERGIRFKFQNYFITFGVIYYFIRFNIDKDRKYLIALLLLLAYVLFIIQGRGYMLGIVFTFLLFYLFNTSFRQLIPIFIKLTLFILFALFLINLFMPDYLEMMSNMFAQLFHVLDGEASADISANARIHESSVVFNYFESHPLSIFAGIGKISTQWNGGYETLFGYFFPSDLGPLGEIFLYGIIGFIILHIVPFMMIIKLLIQVPGKENVFIYSLKYLLIYFAFMSFYQGVFVFGFVDYLIPFFIVYAYRRMQQYNNINE